MSKQFFEEVIYKSDESAAQRWIWSIAATLVLMPLLGSVGSALITAMAISCIPYFMYRDIRFTGEEKLVCAIVGFYLVLNLAGAVLFENRGMGLFYATSNLGFISIFFLLPVLRVVPMAKLEESLPWIFALSALTSCVAAGLEIAFGDNVVRAELKSGNPLMLSYMAGAIGLICLVFALRHQQAKRLVSVAGFFASVLTLVFAGGRGPILAMVIGVILCAFLMGDAKRRLRAVIVVLLIGGLIVAVGYMTRDTPLVRGISDRFERTMATFDEGAMEGASDSTAVRLVYITAGLALVENNPVTGYGRQNIMAEAAKLAPEYARGWFSRTHLHNAFLTETASYGIVGLFSFIALLLIPLISVWRRGKAQRSAALVFVVYSAICFFFNIGFYHDVTVFFFVIMTVVLHSWASQGKHKTPAAA